MMRALTRIALGVCLTAAVGFAAVNTSAQSGRRPKQSPRPTVTPTMSTDDVAPAPADVVAAAAPIEWVGSFDVARQMVKDDQIIFVDVYTDWCGFCRMMDRNVFTDASVRQYAAKNVFVKINAEDRGEGTKFARAARVGSYPTLLVYRSDGTLIGRQTGAFRRPGEFLDWLVFTASRR
jgi:thiol:disulfide interchange protein